MSFSNPVSLGPGSCFTAAVRSKVRRISFLILAIVLAGSLISFAAAATGKPSATKSSASSSKKAAAAKKTTTARKTTAARKPASKKVVAKKTTQAKAKRSTRRRATRTVRRRGPQQPTSDRYKEIQAALASAGHLEGEPSGKWDDSSVEAMKQFQEAHSIPPTGKINAISLIALGLGPKRGPAPGAEPVLDTAAADGAKVDR